MLESSYDIIMYIGDVLSKVDPDIISYEISGHTAKTSGENIGILHWTLSCNRSITVLNFLVDQCMLDESKMIISGYSY
jgi:flagellar motor protein MotB